MGNLSPRGDGTPPSLLLLGVPAQPFLQPEPQVGWAPTSKEEEGPGEQQEERGSEEEAQKPCHPPKHHEDEAEGEQNHEGPVHG